MWLRLPPNVDGAALRDLGKQHGVDVRHGAQFSPTGGLGNHLRLSYAFYDDDDIAEGVARLGAALHVGLSSMRCIWVAARRGRAATGCNQIATLSISTRRAR